MTKPPVKATDTWQFGLSWPMIFGLAALAMPRMVLHDLHLSDGAPTLNLFLTLTPFIVWVVVAVRKRVPNVFFTLLAIGFAYGVWLAIIHQLTWISFWGDTQPAIGGSLEDKLNPTLEAIILRAFGAVSSLLTGLVTGAVLGTVAFLVRVIQVSRHKKQLQR